MRLGSAFLHFLYSYLHPSTEGPLTVTRRLPSFWRAVAYLRERRKRESAHEPRKDCHCTTHSHCVVGFGCERIDARTCWR